MREFRTLLLFFLLFFPGVFSSAQTRQLQFSDMDQELGATVGAMMPLNKDAEGDLSVRVDYSHYYKSGIGYRVGGRYTATINEINNILEAPVAFVWRTGTASWYSRMEGVTDGVISSLLYGHPEDAGINALAALFCDFEVFAGLAPGFIIGPQDAGSSWNNGTSETRIWYKSPRKVSLMAEFGVGFSLTIWRLKFKVSPAIHYNITHNFRKYTETTRLSDGEVSAKVQAVTWFATVGGGISYFF